MICSRKYFPPLLTPSAFLACACSYWRTLKLQGSYSFPLESLERMCPGSVSAGAGPQRARLGSPFLTIQLLERGAASIMDS